MRSPEEWAWKMPYADLNDDIRRRCASVIQDIQRDAMQHPREREAPESAWCPDCKATVRPKWIDFGIGPWECHGRGWHHDYAYACPDCESRKLEEHEPYGDEE